MDGALLELRSDDPLIGATIGEHYLIDALVGEGGMGRVYRAHHTRLQRRQFAIKVLLGDLAATIATRMRFAQEANAASRLDHPNVVPVVDFGKTETGLMYLAMELVQGRTLATVIAEEAPLAPDRVVALARQLCFGLAHAHGHDLVHRDFKPDNIVVVESQGGEVPRILDFGLAITHDEETSTRLTTAGLMFGTPLYIAPEQASGGVVDARADQFSLGVTMYEMLTGNTPHDGTAFEVIRRNASETPPPMASRAPVSVPPALEALVARLLSINPDDRFATTVDVIAALDAVSSTTNTVHAAVELRSAPAPHAATTMPSPPTSTPMAPRSRARIAAFAALAAAITLAVIGWRGANRDRPSSIASNEARTTATDTSTATPPTAIEPSPSSSGSNATRTAAATPIESSPSSTATKVKVKTPPRRSMTSRETVTMSATGRTPPTERAAAPTGSTMPTATGSATPEPATPKSGTAEPSIGSTTSAGSAASTGSASPPTSTASTSSASPSRQVTTTPPATTPPIAARRLLVSSSLGALTTRGSLSASVVRRAIERTIPSMTDCVRRLSIASAAPTMTVRATFVIDDRRRATSISVNGSPALAPCVTSALETVRTQDPPDVGTVAVSVEVRFSEGPS